MLLSYYNASNVLAAFFLIKMGRWIARATACCWLPILSKNKHVELQGAVSIRKTVLPGMAIPMLKIRRPNGRLIFNMEITIRR